MFEMADLLKMKVNELKGQLSKLGLNTKGNKIQLVQRLADFLNIECDSLNASSAQSAEVIANPELKSRKTKKSVSIKSKIDPKSLGKEPTAEDYTKACSRDLSVVLERIDPLVTGNPGTRGATSSTSASSVEALPEIASFLESPSFSSHLQSSSMHHKISSKSFPSVPSLSVNQDVMMDRFSGLALPYNPTASGHLSSTELHSPENLKHDETSEGNCRALGIVTSTSLSFHENMFQNSMDDGRMMSFIESMQGLIINKGEPILPQRSSCMYNASRGEKLFNPQTSISYNVKPLDPMINNSDFHLSNDEYVYENTSESFEATKFCTYSSADNLEMGYDKSDANDSFSFGESLCHLTTGFQDPLLSYSNQNYKQFPDEIFESSCNDLIHTAGYSDSLNDSDNDPLIEIDEEFIEESIICEDDVSTFNDLGSKLPHYTEHGDIFVKNKMDLLSGSDLSGPMFDVAPLDGLGPEGLKTKCFEIGDDTPSELFQSKAVRSDLENCDAVKMTSPKIADITESEKSWDTMFKENLDNKLQESFTSTSSSSDANACMHMEMSSNGIEIALMTKHIEQSSENLLDTFNLVGADQFIVSCRSKNVGDLNEGECVSKPTFPGEEKLEVTDLPGGDLEGTNNVVSADREIIECTSRGDGELNESECGINLASHEEEKHENTNLPGVDLRGTIDIISASQVIIDCASRGSEDLNESESASKPTFPGEEKLEVTDLPGVDLEGTNNVVLADREIIECTSRGDGDLNESECEINLASHEEEKHENTNLPEVGLEGTINVVSANKEIIDCTSRGAEDLNEIQCGTNLAFHEEEKCEDVNLSGIDLEGSNNKDHTKFIGCIAEISTYRSTEIDCDSDVVQNTFDENSSQSVECQEGSTSEDTGSFQLSMEESRPFDNDLIVLLDDDEIFESESAQPLDGNAVKNANIDTNDEHELLTGETSYPSSALFSSFTKDDDELLGANHNELIHFDRGDITNSVCLGGSKESGERMIEGDNIDSQALVKETSPSLKYNNLDSVKTQQEIENTQVSCKEFLIRDELPIDISKSSSSTEAMANKSQSSLPEMSVDDSYEILDDSVDMDLVVTLDWDVLENGDDAENISSPILSGKAPESTSDIQKDCVIHNSLSPFEKNVNCKDQIIDENFTSLKEEEKNIQYSVSSELKGANVDVPRESDCEEEQIKIFDEQIEVMIEDGKTFESLLDDACLGDSEEFNRCPLIDKDAAKSEHILRTSQDSIDKFEHLHQKLNFKVIDEQLVDSNDAETIENLSETAQPERSEMFGNLEGHETSSSSTSYEEGTIENENRKDKFISQDSHCVTSDIIFVEIDAVNSHSFTNLSEKCDSSTSNILIENGIRSLDNSNIQANISIGHRLSPEFVFQPVKESNISSEGLVEYDNTKQELIRCPKLSTLNFKPEVNRITATSQENSKSEMRLKFARNLKWISKARKNRWIAIRRDIKTSVNKTLYGDGIYKNYLKKISVCSGKWSAKKKIFNRLLFIKQHYKRWKSEKRTIFRKDYSVSECQLIIESCSAQRNCELEGHISNGVGKALKKTEDFVGESKMNISLTNKEQLNDMESLSFTNCRGVHLDSSTCDLNLQVDGDGITCIPIIHGELACLWGNVRSNFGATQGKTCFQVKILEELSVDHMPDGITPSHGIRVGFSFGFHQLHLGREAMTYAYDSRGKLCDQGILKEGVEPFFPGDIITAYADLTEDVYIITFSKNDIYFGSHLSIPSSSIHGLPIFPHVATRNCSFHVNFGVLSSLQNQWFEPRDEFTMIGRMSDAHLEGCGGHSSLNARDFKAILMCGLPGSGKTHWVQNFLREQSNKEFFSIIGNSLVTERMEVNGNEERWACLANRCIHNLLTRCSEVPRNYILDQTNVYKNSRKKKLEFFSQFKCKFVIVVPSDVEYKRRCEKRKTGGKPLPDAVLMEMKRNFRLPEKDGTVNFDVEFVEENEVTARQIIKDYNRQGKMFYIKHLEHTNVPHKSMKKAVSLMASQSFEERSPTKHMDNLETDNLINDSANFTKSALRPEALCLPKASESSEKHLLLSFGLSNASTCNPQQIVPDQIQCKTKDSHATSELPSCLSADKNLEVSQLSYLLEGTFAVKNQQKNSINSSKSTAQAISPEKISLPGQHSVVNLNIVSKSNPTNSDSLINNHHLKGISGIVEESLPRPKISSTAVTKHQDISQSDPLVNQTVTTCGNVASTSILFPDNFQQMMQYPPPIYYQTPSQGYYHPYMPYASYQHPYYAVHYQQYYGYQYPSPSPVVHSQTQQVAQQPSLPQQHSNAQVNQSNLTPQLPASCLPVPKDHMVHHSKTPISKSHSLPQCSSQSNTQLMQQHPPPLSSLSSSSYCTQNVYSVQTISHKPPDTMPCQNSDISFTKTQQVKTAQTRPDFWSIRGETNQWQSESIIRTQGKQFSPPFHSQPPGQKQQWYHQEQGLQGSNACGYSSFTDFQQAKDVSVVKDVNTAKFNIGRSLSPVSLKKRRNDVEDTGTDSKKVKLLTQVSTNPNPSSFNYSIISSPSVSVNVSQNQIATSNVPTNLTSSFNPRSSVAFANNSYNNCMNNNKMRNINHGNYNKSSAMNPQVKQYQKFPGTAQRDSYTEPNYKVLPKMGANNSRFPMKRPIQPMADGGFHEKQKFSGEAKFSIDQRPFINSGGFYQSQHCSRDVRFQNPPRVPNSRFRSSLQENYLIERYNKNSQECLDTPNFSKHGYAPHQRQSSEPCFNRPFRHGSRPPLMTDPFLKHEMHIEERPRDSNIWY